MSRNLNRRLNQKNAELDLVVFSLNNYHFAIETRAVKEYLTNVKIETIPESEKKHLVGVLRLRGEYHSVIDLTRQFDLSDEPVDWKIEDGKLQKLLVLNSPPQNTSSRIALIIEDISLLFRTPSSRIHSSLPGVLTTRSLIAKKKQESSDDEGKQAKDLLQRMILGIFHDPTIGLIYYLDDNLIHDLIDLTTPTKINPLSLLEKYQEHETEDQDLLMFLKSASREKSLKSKQEGREYLIGRSNGLVLMFPHDLIQILGLTDEFIVLSADELTELSLPNLPDVSNYVLYDGFLHPIIPLHDLLPGTLRNGMAARPFRDDVQPDGQERVDEDLVADSYRDLNAEMVFLVKDPNGRQRFALTLDEFIDMTTTQKILSLSDPALYPHVKQYYPLIEHLALLDHLGSSFSNTVALIVNLNEIIKRVDEQLSTIVADFSWEAFQFPSNLLPTMAARSITQKNLMYLQEMRFSASQENYLSFTLSPSIKLAIPTAAAKEAISITSFDVDEVIAQLSNSRIINSQNVNTNEITCILNPYAGMPVENLFQGEDLFLDDDSGDNSGNLVKKELLRDNLYVLMLTIISESTNDESFKDESLKSLALLCYDPQPLAALNMETIPMSKVKGIPSEVTTFPLKGELKSILTVHEQDERTFILDVDAFISKSLQQA